MAILIQGDCLKVMKTLPSESFDLVFTDPPYARSYIYIWKPLAIESRRLLKPRGSLISLCGNINLPDVMGIVGKHLDYFWCCAMLHSRVSKIPSIPIYNTWKPILWYSRGIPLIYGVIPDGISPFGPQKDDHRWQQPENWVYHFMKALVPEGGMVLDPFVGTGTTCKVCDELRIASIGIDIDPKQIRTAQERVSQP